MLPKCKRCGAQLTIVKTPKRMARWECYGCRIKAKCRIDEKTGCWLWQGAVRNRYGILQIRTGRIRKPCNAHRAAYALWHAPVPKSWAVLHTCEKTPTCCNPEHLYLKQQPEHLCAESANLDFGT